MNLTTHLAIVLGIVFCLAGIGQNALDEEEQSPGEPFRPSRITRSAGENQEPQLDLNLNISRKYIRQSVTQVKLESDTPELIRSALLQVYRPEEARPHHRGQQSHPLADKLTPGQMARIGQLGKLVLSQSVAVGKTVTLNLGPQEGERHIWVGLQGETTERWHRYVVHIDRSPPDYQLKSPNRSHVSTPVVQIIGVTPEALSSVSAKIFTPFGARRLNAGVVDRTVNMDTGNTDECRWQIYDVALMEGVNQISLELEDLAGNTLRETLSLTFDLATDTEAPGIEILHPKSSEEVSGPDFMVRGKVSDPTARVLIVGLTNTPVEAVVTRSGFFFAQGLPIGRGNERAFQVMATDAAGNSSSLASSVKKSPIEVEIENIEVETDLDLPIVTVIDRNGGIERSNITTYTVTGSIDNPIYDVYVNGVKAKVTGTHWVARGVQAPDELGLFEAVPIPPGRALQRAVHAGLPTLEDVGNPKVVR